MADTVEKPQLVAETAGVHELADAYEVLLVGQASVFTSAQQVGVAMAAVRAVVVAEAEAVRAAAAADEAARTAAVASAQAEATALEAKWARVSQGIVDFGDATTKAMVKQSQLTETITAGSYAVQDFAAIAGELGSKLNSVTNNIPQLLVGLDGVGSALSVAATAGGAIYRSWNDIAGLWEARNPFPKAAHDVSALKRELDTAKDSLVESGKAGSGNADPLAKYNERRAKTAKIEPRISHEEERQARLTKFREDHRSKEKESKERPAQFDDTLGKPEQRVDPTRLVGAALPRERLDAPRGEMPWTEEERAQKAEGFNPFNPASTMAFARLNGPAKVAQAAYQAEEPRSNQESNDLTNRAVTEGRRQRPGPFTGYQRYTVEDSDPARGRDESRFIEQQRHDATPNKKLAKQETDAKMKADDAIARHGKEYQVDSSRGNKEVATEKKARARESVELFWDGFYRDIDEEVKEFKAEVKRIREVQGKSIQEEFEARIAANANLREAGGTVAKSDADQRRRERGGQVAGRDFALPEGVLERQMAALFRGRNAGAESANEAARQIAGTGAVDLARRNEAAQTANVIAQRHRPRARPRVAQAPKRAPRPIAGPPKPAPQPQLPSGWRGAGGDQAALGALEQTQQAMAATQQAMAATQARLARLEANAARLGQNATRLGQQAKQNQPSALNSGAGIA